MTPSLFLFFFCTCSQQKSPEPDGSVAVNEEGKRRKCLSSLFYSIYFFTVMQKFTYIVFKQILGGGSDL